MAIRIAEVAAAGGVLAATSSSLSRLEQSRQTGSRLAYPRLPGLREMDTWGTPDRRPAAGTRPKWPLRGYNLAIESGH